MEVEDRLPGRGPTGVHQVHAVGAQPPERPAGDVLCEQGAVGQFIGFYLGKICHVLLGDDKSMSAGRGVDVHEGERPIGLRDLMGG